MKCKPERCPQCGETPAGILEEVRGLALLQPDGRGGYEYSGGTDVWWDTQIAVKDEQGRVLLKCDNGHEWPATKTEGDTAGAAMAEADMAPDVKVTSGNNGGNSGDSGGSSAAPPDDPVFSEETPAEDIEADMAPAPSDQPLTRAEAAKPRRRKAKPALSADEGAQAGA